ncbi:hypothetical protein D3C74_453440 [compost metagenome]
MALSSSMMSDLFGAIVIALATHSLIVGNVSRPYFDMLITYELRSPASTTFTIKSSLIVSVYNLINGYANCNVKAVCIIFFFNELPVRTPSII